MKRLAIFLTMLAMTGTALADGEIHAPYWSGSTLYFIRYEQLDGDALLSDGLSSEVYGTGGRDADDYDIPMTENGDSGHYVGNFDTLTNIGAGTYYFDIFVQAGGSPADSDQPAGFWGSLVWTGTAEDRRATQGDIDGLNNFDPANDTVANVTLVDTTTSNDDMRGTDGANTTVPDAAGTAAGLHSTTDGKIDTTDALITSKHSDTDGLIVTVDGNVDSIKAVTDLLPDGGALTSLATLANQTWLINFSEADTFTDIETTPWREIIRLKGTTTPITEKELFGTEGEDIVAKTQRIGQIKEPD